MTEALKRDGLAVVPEVLNASTVAALIAAVSGAGDGSGSQRRGSVYALRNLMEDVPEVAALADSAVVRALIAPILGPGCFPVRGILFDKTPEANWNVVWHQDLSIAVRERRDVEGFGTWSEKAGVVHVQPPAHILERMLTVRLHLDDCDETNGPLLVLPGSHLGGRLAASEIQQRRTQAASVPCPVPSGGALLMRPLLLHASSASQSPRHRRVIHLEYAAEPLLGGLQWHQKERRETAAAPVYML